MLKKILVGFLATCILAAFPSACGNADLLKPKPRPTDEGGPTNPPPLTPVNIPFFLDTGAAIDYVDASNNHWLSDRYYTVGAAPNWGPISILNTVDDTLHQTERWFNGTLTYTIPINPGTYDVTLYFSENATCCDAAGVRKFDIEVEDVQIENDYDIFTEAGGANRAITVVATGVVITAPDDDLTIDLIKVTQNPKIDAIKITGSGGHVADFPRILDTQTTSIENPSVSAPAHRVTFTPFVDSATPDPTDTMSTTAAIGDTLIFGIAFRDSDGIDTISSVTCGSQTAVPLVTRTNTGGGYRQVAWYGILSNTIANCSVVVTYSANTNQSAIVGLAYTSMDSFGAVSSSTTGCTGNTDNWDCSITSNRDNSTLVGIGILGDGSADPFTPDDTETERADGSTASAGTNDLAYHVLELAAPTAGTYNLGGASTPLITARWTSAVIELRSASGSASEALLADGDSVGDLHVLQGCTGGALNVGTPVGWTPVGNLNGIQLPNAAGRMWTFYRLEDAGWPGSETAVPLSLGGAQESAWIDTVIEEHAASTITIHGLQNTGQVNTANPDPPNLPTFSAANEDFLALAGFVADETSNTSPYAPSGYTAVAQVESSNTADSCSINLASRDVSDDSENPGTMTYGTGTEESVAFTIAIYHGDEGTSVVPNPAPVCSPSSQNVAANTTAVLTATGGNGTFAWTATGGTPSSGSGSSFSVSYGTTGTKTITLTSDGQTDTCLVVVSTPTTSGPGATGVYIAWPDGKLYAPDGTQFRVRGVNMFAQGDAATDDEYMGFPGWKINYVRIPDIDRPQNGIPSSTVISAINAFRDPPASLGSADGSRVVTSQYHLTNGIPQPGGYPGGCAEANFAGGCDTSTFITYYTNLVNRYKVPGGPGGTPDPDFWPQIYNEPANMVADNDRLVGGVRQCDWQDGPGEDVTKYIDYIEDVTIAIRNAGYLGPIVIPSQQQGADICVETSFDYSEAFQVPLPQRSFILTWDDDIRAVVPDVCAGNGGVSQFTGGSCPAGQQRIDNIIYDMHLYGAWNATGRGCGGTTHHMQDFLQQINARKIHLQFGEYASMNRTQSNALSMENMFSCRFERTGLEFGDIAWDGNGVNPNRLTNTAPRTGNEYGISDIQCNGGDNCKTVNVKPTNLERLGDILWQGTH